MQEDGVKSSDEGIAWLSICKRHRFCASFIKQNSKICEICAHLFAERWYDTICKTPNTLYIFTIPHSKIPSPYEAVALRIKIRKAAVSFFLYRKFCLMRELAKCLFCGPKKFWIKSDIQKHSHGRNGISNLHKIFRVVKIQWKNC